MGGKDIVEEVAFGSKNGGTDTQFVDPIDDDSAVAVNYVPIFLEEVPVVVVPHTSDEVAEHLDLLARLYEDVGGLAASIFSLTHIPEEIGLLFLFRGGQVASMFVQVRNRPESQIQGPHNGDQLFLCHCIVNGI